MNQTEIQLKADNLIQEFQNLVPVSYEEAVKIALLTSKRVLSESPSCTYWSTYNDETPSAIIVWSEIRDYLETLIVLDESTENE